MVGGDWADCWQLADGRVALVVGDVVGKGLGAAATMGRLRSAIRALVHVDPTPATVLARLDALESAEGSVLVATVLYALLDPRAGHAVVGRAGHLPLAVAEPGAPVRLVDDVGSAPVGVGAGSRPDVLVPFPPGTVIALFTDGLVERRDRRLSDGLAEVERVLATPYADAEAAANALMSLTPSRPTDDIALLVVRCRESLR
jgi:serine phosphatase RsbU (regulator of sigma subunit)